MSISAMKQALNALENSHAYLPVKTGIEREVDQAITALREAIAEAEQPDLARVGEVGVWGDKREWVGLTHEERDEIDQASRSQMEALFAIEAKLKEKNNG